MTDEDLTSRTVRLVFENADDAAKFAAEVSAHDQVFTWPDEDWNLGVESYTAKVALAQADAPKAEANHAD